MWIEYKNNMTINFVCQLARTYRPTKDYEVSGWWSSPKLDGVRCLFLPGQGLYSRTLKTKFVGLEHIEQVCREIGFNVIDGELYIPGEKFDRISGIARDRKNYDPLEKTRLQFHVFALWSATSAWQDTDEMLNSIPATLPKNQSIVVPVPHVFIENNPLAIQNQCQFYQDQGFSQEGMMLRHQDVAYYQGRSDHLLKVKNFTKSNFRIVNFSRGRGKYGSSLGRILVEGFVGGTLVSARVGSGFSDAERQLIWNNQTQFLHTEVEIIYLGVTARQSLRHPVFSKFV